MLCCSQALSRSPGEIRECWALTPHQWTHIITLGAKPAQSQPSSHPLLSRQGLVLGHFWWQSKALLGMLKCLHLLQSRDLQSLNGGYQQETEAERARLRLSYENNWSYEIFFTSTVLSLMRGAHGFKLKRKWLFLRCKKYLSRARYS